MNAGAPCHIAGNAILYQLKNFLVRKFLVNGRVSSSFSLKMTWPSSVRIYLESIRGLMAHTGLHINIDPDIGDMLRQNSNGSPSPKSKFRALLDPLCLLPGVREVNITGSGHGGYLSHINASICGPEPNAEETKTV